MVLDQTSSQTPRFLPWWPIHLHLFYLGYIAYIFIFGYIKNFFKKKNNIYLSLATSKVFFPKKKKKKKKNKKGIRDNDFGSNFIPNTLLSFFNMKDLCLTRYDSNSTKIANRPHKKLKLRSKHLSAWLKFSALSHSL